jgi:dipeptidyl aminopeptidase/acylaminoacyl peptidase
MAGMIPADIDSLVQATEVALSPDGTMVAFTVKATDVDRNEYRSRIWLAPADGTSAPRPFTAGILKDRLPRWSPDGSFLALVSDRAIGQEDSASEIVAIPVGGGGERAFVVSWPEQIDELSWSPDGSRLAFVARDRDEARYGAPGESAPKDKDLPPRRLTRLFWSLDSEGWVVDRPTHVFVVAADGSTKPRCLTPGEHQASGLTWSPDGLRLAFVSARHDSWDLDLATDLWSVTADGQGQPVRLTETVASYGQPSWSPDGSQLAYLRWATPLEEPRHAQVGVLTLATGERRELTHSLDRNCAPFPGARSPVWLGQSILFGVEDAGSVHLYRVDADGDGQPELVVGGQRCSTGWDAAGETITFVASHPQSLGEVFTTGVESGLERRLTDFTGPFIGRLDLAAPERFTAISADGTEVECWAMAPVDAAPGTRYPTVLNIHGGPFTQYGYRFFDEFQVQVGAGLGVVYCNPRGSSGYSEAWGRATRWPEAETDPGSGWGGVDYDDVMACMEEACKRFSWIDDDRLGVMGGSYGGYMTSWIIAHNDRFRAACSERSCNNLLALEQHSDVATGFRTYVGRSHLEDPAAYLRQSPITYVEDMRTPVLILHSEEDLRCPISQGDELFVALRLLGQHPEFVRFPGESHELSRSGSPKHRVMRAQIIVDWFVDHLGRP